MAGSTIDMSRQRLLDHKIDGVDLLPYALGTKNDTPHETLFWRAGDYRTVRHMDWKMATDPNIGKTWLFDLGNDPGETTNLANQSPEIVEMMMSLLAQHNSEMVPPLWDSAAMMPVNVDKHLRQEMDPEKDTYIYWGN